MPRTANIWPGLLDRNTLARSIPSVLKGLAGHPVPLRVTHCITYRCNLECAYCSRHDIPEIELSTEAIKRLMRALKLAGTRFWSFNGGEALLREDLGTLLAYGKSTGMIMSFATNGVLVAERADEIGDAALVSVSLDGPRHVQDEVRSSSYDAVIEGLEAMAARDIRFSLFAVVGSHNIGALDEVIDLAEAFHTAVFFQPVRIQSEDTDEKSRRYFPEAGQMKDAMAHLIDEKKRGRPVASSYGYLETIGKCWPCGMPDVQCFGGKLFCFITPEGFVTQCCDTLRAAPAAPECDLTQYGTNAIGNIPPCRCTTCYSSLPLEANLLFTASRRNPLSAAGKVLSGLLFPGRAGSATWGCQPKADPR